MEYANPIHEAKPISLFEIPQYPNTQKIESKKAAKTSYRKKKSRSYTAKEPLKNVANGSWRPGDQKQKNLRLVEDA